MKANIPAVDTFIAINPWFWGLPVLLVFAGFSMAVSNTSANALLQATDTFDVFAFNQARCFVGLF